MTGSTTIIYDAEIKEPTCLEAWPLMTVCLKLDTERSYLYLREGSFEKNIGLKCCIAGCPLKCKTEITTVEYFDKRPWKRPNKACLGICIDQYPRVEMYVPGYVCCGKDLRTCHPCCESYYAACDPDRVVLMPSEMCPAPCCCQPNRTTVLDKCCNICGPPPGQPKWFGMFLPQPADPRAFVAVCHEHMIRDL